MTLQEQRDVLQAAIDRKVIQFRRRGGDQGWEQLPLAYLSFDFQTWEYRVKREPREWWLAGRLPVPGRAGQAFAIRDEAEYYASCGEIIRVREVLE